MEFRVLSLGDWMDNPVTGARKSQAERFADLIELGVMAERLGFEGYHLGEHHFCDYIVSNPVPLLAAVAAKTDRIKLSTGVALAANRDPVLLAEDYATLDLISNGRMELCVGRGNAFFECYRQMGQDLGASQEMFDANLDLIADIWSGGQVSSDGKTRHALKEASVQPQPVASPQIWVGAGSSAESVMRVADRKLNLQLPGVFAPPSHFAEFAQTYREAYPDGKVGFTAHVHVREDGEAAKREWEPYHLSYLNWVNRIISGGSDGVIPYREVTSPEFAYLDPDKSPALCGSPREVADRLLSWSETLGGLDQVILKFDGGALPMDDVERSMALVAGPVREMFEAG